MARKPEPKGPKPPLPGLVKWEVLFETVNPPVSSAANIFHLMWADSVDHSFADLTTLIAACRTKYAQHMIPLINSEWNQIGMKMTALGGSGLDVQDATLTNGGASGECLPPQVSICISWISNIFARGGKPRTYMPGVSTANLTPGGTAGITPTAAALYLSTADAFMNDVNTASAGGVQVKLGAVSYFKDYAFLIPPVFHSFLGARVHQRVDSQRRRSGKESTFPIS